MKEPFTYKFPAPLLKKASYQDECPTHFHPRISYAAVSYMTVPELQFLKQLYSGSNIFTALLHSQVKEATMATTIVEDAFLGFFYVMEGDVTILMRGESEMVCLEQGTAFIVYIPAGEYPSPWLPGKSTVAYFVLHPRLVKKMFNDYPELQPAFEKLLQNDPDPTMYHLCKISRSMHVQLRKVGSYSQHKVLETESAIQALFSDLLEAQLQQMNAHQYSSSGRLEIVIRVYEYIMDNSFSGQLPSIEEIAEKHNIGYRTLLREFKERFGFTVKEIINFEKMDAAHYLVSIDKRPVAEVSIRFGYGNPQSFSRSFKKYFGYPPSEAKDHPFPKVQRKSKNVR